jgi:hypothetical protein
MAKKAKAKKAKTKKAKTKKGKGRGKAKKPSIRNLAMAGSNLATAAATPVATFMCFRTADPNVFIKCEWNPVEKRFNLNCRPATRSECQE